MAKQGTSAIYALTGYEEGQVIQVECNTNLLYPRTVLPPCWRSFRRGKVPCAAPFTATPATCSQKKFHRRCLPLPMDYKATLQRAAEKFRTPAALAAAEGLIPYKSENGRWIPSPYDGNSWWTGGFWPGLMWQFYAATGDEAFSP